MELTGVPTMLAWMGQSISHDELLRMWLSSPVVRAFETGRITPQMFCDQLIAEMTLRVKTPELLAEFTQWAISPLPGALELVSRVPRRYIRATLSNSNTLHWPRLMQEMKLEQAFDHHFASHLTGKIKPDEEAFLHVVECLNCTPSEVLFIDDSQLNVEAATRVGMRAVGVKGVAEAERALVQAGVIES